MPSISIRKRPTRWELRYRGDKERTKSFPLSLSRRQIEKIRESEIVKWRQGVDPFGQKEEKAVSLEGAILAYREEREKYWSDKTRQTNADRLSYLLSFTGNDLVSSINTGKYKAWIDGLDVAATTKKSYASTVNTFLTWMLDKGYLKEKVKIKLEPGTLKALKKKRIKYITLDQLYKTCEALENIPRSKHAPRSRNRLYMKDIWQFAFWQLLRRDEIIRITPGDVSPDLRFITVHGKGGNVDTVPIVEPAKTILSPWLEDAEPSQPLFGLTASKNLWKAFNECVNIACPDAGLNLHSLRHGGIVHYLSQGIGLNFVSKLARHKNIKITADTYADIIPSSVEDAFKGVG